MSNDETKDNTTPTTQVRTESARGGRAHLSLRPTAAKTESQRDAATDAFLADQKAQKAMSRGGRDYLDIDDAYDLGVGVTFKTVDPHNSRTTSIRQVDPTHKAHLDNMLKNGLISQQGYETEIQQILGDEPFADAAPDAGLPPLEYDAETSQHAHWTIGQVGETAFRSAMTSYVMGDSTAAMNIANQLQEHGVTPNDITGMYDSMAQTAAGKISAVMEANGDLDVDVNEVIEWARSLEPGQQVYHLTRTAMAGALFNNFQHVPQVVQAYRLATRRPR